MARTGKAEDFDQFYATRATGEHASGELQIITSDGKGVVMRREDLREAKKKAAERSRHKLGKRLSKGEKRNRKRMATLTDSAHFTRFARFHAAGNISPLLVLTRPISATKMWR